MKIIEAVADSGATLTKFELTVEAIDSLPTMPAIAQKLLSVTGSADCSLDDVEELIAADQALVVRVMRLASSAALSRRPVSTLRAALARIGLRDLRKLIVAALMIQTDAPGRLHLDVWRNSLVVGSFCEAIAACLKQGAIEDPFLCGLLHDVGLVALERVLGDDYTDLHEQPGHGDVRAIEREKFGFDHCDMGTILAREWSLFPTLVSVMQLHHCPLEAREVTDDVSFHSVCAVALARDLADEVETDQTLAVCEALGLTILDAREAAAKGRATYERLYANLVG